MKFLTKIQSNDSLLTTYSNNMKLYNSNGSTYLMNIS